MRKIVALAATLALGGLALTSCSQKPPMAAARATRSPSIGPVGRGVAKPRQDVAADLRRHGKADRAEDKAVLFDLLYRPDRGHAFFNQVQAGFFSSASGLEATRRAGGEIFVHNTNPDGSDGYSSIVITRADSKVTLADVLKCDHKINFGMGDVKSTSGTVAPKAFLFLPKGINTDNCFKNVKSGSHGANIEGVIAGVLDAATANTDSLKELSDTADGRAKLAKIKVLWAVESAACKGASSNIVRTLIRRPRKSCARSSCRMARAPVPRPTASAPTWRLSNGAR